MESHASSLMICKQKSKAASFTPPRSKQHMTAGSDNGLATPAVLVSAAALKEPMVAKAEEDENRNDWDDSFVLSVDSAGIETKVISTPQTTAIEAFQKIFGAFMEVITFICISIVRQLFAIQYNLIVAVVSN